MNNVHKTVLAGATALALGAFAMGSAFASGSNSGPPSVDPYTYDYSAPSEGARADVSSARDQVSAGVYDSHGHLIGFTSVASPAK